jgi:hypothetical protein
VVVVVVVATVEAEEALAAVAATLEALAVVDFMVAWLADSAAVDFIFAASGAVSGLGEDSTPMTTTMTMLTTRMDTTIHTMTMAVAMSFGDTCTPRMVGACAPFRCAVDGLRYIGVDRASNSRLKD